MNISRRWKLINIKMKKDINYILTALLSVATPEITNIKRKEAMISMIKDRISDPTGKVPKYAVWGTSKRRHSVPLARMDPNTCATTYRGTCKCNASITN